MAYPGDPSGPAAKGPGAFAGGRLTADDFDQLAAAFRPSWELDEAPFTGAGTMSAADVRALQGGGGMHAELRAAPQVVAAPVSNGTHAFAKPAHVAPAHEPVDSVIVDRGLAAVEVAPPPPLQVRVPAAPMTAAPVSPDRLAQTRIIQRPVQVPIARESTGSFDAAALRGSKRPLWIGLGAGAIGLAVVGIWAASGSSDAAKPAAVPASIATTTQTAASPDIPPPPPETTPTPAPTPVPRTVEISSLAQVPATAVAPAPVRPAPATASPSPAPHPAAAPTPRPAPRPKAAGGTIVHDVPF